MSYAMRDALATSPSAVATEIASGSVTTKLSSCFGCTTYMWANGFPPSATHLGQANSWHPLFLSKESDGKKQAIVQSMNTRFHLQVHGYIMRGAEILASVGGIRQGNVLASYVHLYFATLISQDPDTWGGLKKVLTEGSDVRF